MLSINIEAEVGVICAIPRLNLTIAIHCNPLGCMDEISLTQILITIKKSQQQKQARVYRILVNYSRSVTLF